MGQKWAAVAGKLEYHLVLPAKYRRTAKEADVDGVLKEAHMEFEKRYQVKILEIGTMRGTMHFRVQCVPAHGGTSWVRMIAGIMARKVFRRCPKVKKRSCGGKPGTAGHVAGTVSKHAAEPMAG